MKITANKKKVTTGQYDVASMEIERVASQWLLWRMFPYGISGIGPFIKQLVMLWLHHRFGYFVIKRKMKHEQAR